MISRERGPARRFRLEACGRGATATGYITVALHDLAPGTYPLTLTGTSGSLRHAVALTLAKPRHSARTSTLTVRTTRSAKRGTFTITIRGTSGSLDHQVTATLVVRS